MKYTLFLALLLFSSHFVSAAVPIVVSPSVDGNIGSCTTNVTVQALSRDSFFVGSWESIATNSCNGQVVRHTYWELTGDFWAVILIFSVLLGIFIFVKGITS